MNSRERAAALLASAWAFPAVLLGSRIASTFQPASTRVPLFLGMPVDLLGSRALVEGAAAALWFPTARPSHVYLGCLLLRLTQINLTVSSPSLATLLCELPLTALSVLPAQAFARWTRNNERLLFRAALHPIFHAAWLLWLLPEVLTGPGAWDGPFARSSFENKIYLQLWLVPAIVLLTAVSDFATQGDGTPMPADPPRRLVWSGPYAYVANPMQLGKIGVVGGWGLFWHPLVIAAALFGLLYSLLIAAPREERAMSRRFPEEWRLYREQVGRWLPRRRPALQPKSVATLHLDLGCTPCHEAANWLGSQRTPGLQMCSLQPGRRLGRILYDSGDSHRPDAGVLALARALEHIHLGWAFFGWTLRLPGLSTLAQIVLDAFDPRTQRGPYPALLATSGASRTRTRNAPPRGHRLFDLWD